MIDHLTKRLVLESCTYIELVPFGARALAPEDTVALHATTGVGERSEYFTYGTGW